MWKYDFLSMPNMHRHVEFVLDGHEINRIVFTLYVTGCSTINICISANLFFTSQKLEIWLEDF